MTDTELQLLKQQCQIVLPGHRMESPATNFRSMADWCEAHHIRDDLYGEGELIQRFEQKVAGMLGRPAGLFCVTGTMVQATVLRLACEQRRNPLVALHPTSHILVHERSNFQIHQDFIALLTGPPHRVWGTEDLSLHPEKPAAAQYELPMREIGGQLPDWGALDALKRYCRTQDIHLHMDGARLWEAACGYGKTLQEVAEGFDSVYVSFYKGIGAMGGAMLLGSTDLIAKARLSFQRQGGNLFRFTPYVVAAAMQFERRLAQMPACLERTRAIFRMLAQFPRFKPNPSSPQVNMLHIHLPVDKDHATAARNHIAAEHGIWLFNQAVHAALPGHSVFEWYVGDQATALSETELHRALSLLHQACETR